MENMHTVGLIRLIFAAAQTAVTTAASETGVGTGYASNLTQPFSC